MSDECKKDHTPKRLQYTHERLSDTMGSSGNEKQSLLTGIRRTAVRENIVILKLEEKGQNTVFGMGNHVL